MTTVNPLESTLQAAAAASQADASQVAQPIEQQEVQQNYQAQSLPAVNNNAVAQHHVQPTNLTMDSSDVQNESSIGSFLKLTDGGVEVSDTKYGAIKVALRVEDAANGGGFKPARMMNYEGAQGMVYTKTYDGANTESNSPAHSNLSWAANCEKIMQLSPKAYSYLGYDLALVVSEDVKPLKAGGEVLKAGTVLGFTTPYTASKLFLAAWKAAVAASQRGNDVILELEGEEISKNSRMYKVLRMKTLGYKAPQNYLVEDADAE